MDGGIWGREWYADLLSEFKKDKEKHREKRIKFKKHY